MEYYSGLDASLKDTFVTIIDKDGDLVKEQIVPTNVDAIWQCLNEAGLKYSKIDIESGQLSISLCKGLKQRGLPVICVDARAIAASLSARINKNDKNNALGIAQMMRANLYEAAQSLLVVSKKKNKIKNWGLKIAKKKGMKKAIVAVARKLAVVMHRMLVSRTEFCC